jgi:hypothetical protein
MVILAVLKRFGGPNCGGEMEWEAKHLDKGKALHYNASQAITG